MAQRSVFSPLLFASPLIEAMQSRSGRQNGPQHRRTCASCTSARSSRTRTPSPVSPSPCLYFNADHPQSSPSPRTSPLRLPPRQRRQHRYQPHRPRSCTSPSAPTPRPPTTPPRRKSPPAAAPQPTPPLRTQCQARQGGTTTRTMRAGAAVSFVSGVG
jgi:hypothetical protein